MKNKKECVAMLLAGGQGTRLELLTQKNAKPAVYFGGKYRIIDFPLSNCANSGIDVVGVLTQYEPLVLNSYIGTGSPWDLDRRNGGVFVLPPYVESGGGDWYRGTANAIYQNINFIDQYDPDHVLILSGDHIYKMNYSLMLNFHKEKNADATIACIEVPLEDASRFGIMNTLPDGEIFEFEEKPAEPKNNLASMGVYIFKWDVLRKALIEDEQNELSSNDFGKDVIPMLLRQEKRLYAYTFNGYWRDVGTVQSLWEANMDLTKDEPELNLNDPSWRIYSRNENQPALYTSPTAKIKQSVINDGCSLDGEITRSVIFYGVEVGKDSRITDSVIMPNVKIGKNVVIHRAIIGNDTIIEDGCYIVGKDDEITLIGENSKVTSNSYTVI